MAKEKQVFYCKECGYESAKWLGQCPGCHSWNAFVEEKITVGAQKHSSGKKNVVAPTSILEVTTADESRIKTNIGELDRVLGGGIVKGSLVLVGGDPGIGKSTLLSMITNANPKIAAYHFSHTGLVKIHAKNLCI